MEQHDGFWIFCNIIRLGFLGVIVIAILTFDPAFHGVAQPITRWLGVLRNWQPS
jgi:hypothetical protein